jgi:uncharacterized repeat protein (TIGR01451 family)
MKAKNFIPVMFLLLFQFFITGHASAQIGILKEMKNLVKEGDANSSASVADLGLELSVDNVNAGAGETVVFTIIVTNDGPADATGVEVTDKLPGGYTHVSSSTLFGSYNNGTGLWAIGTLANGKSAILTITATVNMSGDYMNLAEVTASNQQDPDSKPGDGVDTDKDTNVVDDPGDDDDGDGQDVKPKLKKGSSLGGIAPIGIKAFLKDHKKRTQTYIFDAKSIAMRVEFDPKEKQKPMYFDEKGYVYTASNKGYVKVPFEKLKKLGGFTTFISNGVLPPIPFPDGSVKYYGMDVSPKRFPILEWAFVYKTSYFEGNTDFKKQDLECRGQPNCAKYTLTNGKDAGSYVLFDSEQRLAEIFATRTGNIVYTYEDHTVQLPNAQEMPFMTDLFNK